MTTDGRIITLPGESEEPSWPLREDVFAPAHESFSPFGEAEGETGYETGYEDHEDHELEAQLGLYDGLGREAGELETEFEDEGFALAEPEYGESQYGESEYGEYGQAEYGEYGQAEDEAYDEYGQYGEFETYGEDEAFGPDEFEDHESPATVAAGSFVVPELPLLKRHAGTPPDLVLSWNTMAAPAAVDVVVHLHGHSPRGRAMRIDRDMMPVSGLDFADPGGTAAGRTSPTLLVLPRGHFYGGRYGRGYTFPALEPPGALDGLVAQALRLFGERTGVRAPRGRLILTAHSGGGASLMHILRHANPDEVHTFDALYTDPTPLIEWARRRIARREGALRVLYRPGEPTAANSGSVRAALGRALRDADPALRKRFRVEATHVPHMRIPPTFGWRLLADPAADLPHLAVPARRHQHEYEAGAIDHETADRPRTTAQIRRAWARYRCAEREMVPLRLLSHRTPVNPLAVDAFRALAAALTASGYRAKSTWVYNCRSIASSGSTSLHAYGLAVDIDPRHNPHRHHQVGPIVFSDAPTEEGRARDVQAGRAGTVFTPAQVAAVEAIRTVDGLQVFRWGGRWRGSHDAMHFEVRLTPAELARGIAPASGTSGEAEAEHETCEAWESEDPHAEAWEAEDLADEEAGWS
jgi:D-alanyl-D-alanine carboxypeptidase